MMNKYVVRGFHGTTEANADKIISQQEMIGTDRDYHWLGKGAYFFEDAPLRAWKFAKEWVCRKRKDNPAVISVDIDLTDAINLLDLEHWHGLRQLYGVMNHNNEIEKQSGPLISDANGIIHGVVGCPTVKGNFIGNNVADCKVIKAYAIELNEVDDSPVTAVRSAFIEGEQLFENSYFFDHMHIQIAVRNSSIISNFVKLNGDVLDDSLLQSKMTRWPVTDRSALEQLK